MADKIQNIRIVYDVGGQETQLSLLAITEKFKEQEKYATRTEAATKVLGEALKTQTAEINRLTERYKILQDVKDKTNDPKKILAINKEQDRLNILIGKYRAEVDKANTSLKSNSQILNDLKLKEQSLLKLRESNPKIYDRVTKQLDIIRDKMSRIKDIEAKPTKTSFIPNLPSLGDTASNLLSGGGLTSALSTLPIPQIAAAGAAVAVVGSELSAAREEAKAFESSLMDFSAITGVEGAELDKVANIAKGFNVELRKSNGELISITNSATSTIEALKLVAGQKPELLENTDALIGITEEALVLSKASGGDLSESILAVTGILAQFGGEASDAKRIINELAAGSKEGSIEILPLTKVIEKAGVSFSAFGLSASEAIAITEIAGKKIRNVDVLGTSLLNTFSKLSAKELISNEGLEALERAGVSTKVLFDVSKPAIERLRELSKVQNDANAIALVFGEQGKASATAILQEIDALEDLIPKVQGTSQAYEQAAKNADTLVTQEETLKNAIEANRIEIGEKLLPIYKAWTDAKLFIIKAIPDLIGGLARLSQTILSVVSPALGDFVGRLIGLSKVGKAVGKGDNGGGFFENLGKDINNSFARSAKEVETNKLQKTLDVLFTESLKGGKTSLNKFSGELNKLIEEAVSSGRISEAGGKRLSNIFGSRVADALSNISETGEVKEASKKAAPTITQKLDANFSEAVRQDRGFSNFIRLMNGLLVEGITDGVLTEKSADRIRKDFQSKISKIIGGGKISGLVVEPIKLSPHVSFEPKVEDIDVSDFRLSVEERLSEAFSRKQIEIKKARLSILTGADTSSVQDSQLKDLEASLDFARELYEALETDLSVGRQERLAAQEALVDAEIALEEYKQSKISDIQSDANDERQKDFEGLLNFAQNGLSALTSVFEGIDAARIASAEGNEAKLLQIRKASFERNKALAIAEATIQGALAVTQVFANPAYPDPISKAIAIGLIGSTTLANIIKIGSTQFEQFNKGVIDLKKGGGVIDDVPALLTRGESVMTKEETEKFKPTFMAIRKGQIDPNTLNAIATGAGVDSKGERYAIETNTVVDNREMIFWTKELIKEIGKSGINPRILAKEIVLALKI